MKRQIARLGTALLVVAAFGATVSSAAQAAPEWLIKEEKVTASEQLNVTESKGLFFHMDIGGASFDWSCETPGVTEGTIGKEGKGQARFAPFHCLMSAFHCEAKLTSSPVLVNTELISGPYIKFSKPGTLWAWELAGATCEWTGFKWSVSGSFAAEISGSPFEELEHTFEFSSAIGTAAGTKLQSGAFKVEITSGSYTNKLAGAHENQKWSAK